jgi:hypothetical protein
MRTNKKRVAEDRVIQEVGGYLTDDAIREKAYELYKKRGGASGLEVEDWLAAEADLKETVPA